MSFKKTNLISLLSTLSTREQTRFSKYVHSPFFNRHEKLRLLCDWALQYAPAFDHPGCNRMEGWKAMHPNKPYDDLRFNNFTSSLLRLLYDFLAYLQYESSPVQSRLLLFEELSKRDAKKLLQQNVQRTSALIKKQAERSCQYYLLESQLQSQLDQVALQNKQRRITEHLQLESNNLDLYFWVNKLRIACTMKSRSGVFSATYQAHFTDFIRQQYAQYTHLSGNPVLEVYLKTLQMLEGRSDSRHLYELMALMSDHSSLFPKEELSTLYHYALNFCIRQINTGQESFYRQVFELYQVMLNEALLLHHGQLSQFAFKNIITTSIRLKEFEWTDQFIQSYQELLPEQERENAVTYNAANLWYAKGDYANALRCLQNVEFTDNTYHLGVKLIQLKSYYELEEASAFYALLEAFKKLIFRNKALSDYRKQAYGNFLLLAKRIYQLREQKKLLSNKDLQKKKDGLETSLETMSPIVNKRWLVTAFSNI